MKLKIPDTPVTTTCITAHSAPSKAWRIGSGDLNPLRMATARRPSVPGVGAVGAGEGEVLIRTGAVGICGSDREVFEGRFKQSEPPLILGHESVGTVLEVGRKVSRYRPGQRVLRPGAVYADPAVGIASAWGGLAEYGLVTDVVAWREDHPGEPVPNGMWIKQQIVPPEIEPGEAIRITDSGIESMLRVHARG